VDGKSTAAKATANSETWRRESLFEHRGNEIQIFSGSGKVDNHTGMGKKLPLNVHDVVPPSRGICKRK